MKTLKTVWSALCARFESKWYYFDNNTVRVHKVTGKIEYDHVDDWGHFWMDEPQFAGA